MNWPSVSLFACGSVHPLRAALVVLAVIGLLGVPAAVSGAPLNNATVSFGNPNAPGAAQGCNIGAPGVPPDPCANAFHKLIPGAVTIQRGDSVTFNRVGFHQIAIYKPGVNPNAIPIPDAASRVNFLGPTGTERVFLSEAPPAPPAPPGPQGGNVPVTFTTTPLSETGRYLVICNITTHFRQNMWGWVEVQ
jgi:plastocyanin